MPSSTLVSWEQQVALVEPGWSNKAWLSVLHTFLGVCLRCCSMAPLPLWEPEPTSALCCSLAASLPRHNWNTWSFQATSIKALSRLHWNTFLMLKSSNSQSCSETTSTPALMVKTILVFLLGIYCLLKVPSWVSGQTIIVSSAAVIKILSLCTKTKSGCFHSNSEQLPPCPQINPSTLGS